MQSSNETVDATAVLVKFTYGGLIAVGNPEVDAASVESAWKKLGVSVTVSKTGAKDPVTVVSGSGGPIGALEFLANHEDNYGLSAASICVPGDPSKE